MKFIIFLCGAFLLPVATLKADDAEAQLRLQAAMRQLDSFQASFKQTVRTDKQKVLQQSSGQLGIERPGKFYWNYQTPYEQRLISDAKNLWVYDVDLKQASVRPVDQALGSAPIMVLMQPQADLEQAFSVHEVGQRKYLYWLELEPKTQDMEFDRIYLGLEKDQIKAMELRDRFGQSTQIVFSDLRVGVIQNPARFQFEVPPGVDVIGQANP